MTTHFFARNLTDARILQSELVQEGDTLTGSLLRFFVLARCISEEEFDSKPEAPGAKIGDIFWEIITKDEEIITQAIKGARKVVFIDGYVGEA